MKRLPVHPLDPSRPWPHHLQWYAVITEPRCEFVVASRFERDGIFTWTPTREKATPLSSHNHRRSWSKLTSKPVPVKAQPPVPILSGFVFAGFTAPPCWLDIRATPNVIDVVSNNHDPLRIKATELARFRDSLQKATGKALEGLELKLGTKYRLVLGGLLEAPEVFLDHIPAKGDHVFIKGLFGVPTRVGRDRLEEIPQ